MNESITGTEVQYLMHCKRHLWLFSHRINFEQESEDVLIGKIIGEKSFSRRKHEIIINSEDFVGVVDFMDKKRRVIHEIKKSPKRQDLHLWQMKFYLFILEKMGLKDFTGEINYPRQKKILRVRLTEDDRRDLTHVLKELQEIRKMSLPPSPLSVSFCKNCSYFEFCHA